MKKLISILTFVLFFGTLASAQDIITMRNGDEVSAVVSEVNTDNIKYKKFSNPSGPTYTIAISDVFMIRYQNGEQDVFSEATQPTAPLVDSDVQRGLKYKQLKTMYNPREYVKDFSDPHSPGWCAVGSLLIPGLGQACCGEWGRAIGFFCANMGLNLAYQATENFAWQALSIAVDIWATCDAVRVAKVINMYAQDLRGIASMNFYLYPNIAYIPSAYGLQPTAGMTLSIAF